MMLAEAGICGNRGVADGGPFVGLGLFQPMCNVMGSRGRDLRRGLFLGRYPFPDRLLKAI